MARVSLYPLLLLLLLLGALSLKKQTIEDTAQWTCVSCIDLNNVAASLFQECSCCCYNCCSGSGHRRRSCSLSADKSVFVSTPSAPAPAWPFFPSQLWLQLLTRAALYQLLLPLLLLLLGAMLLLGGLALKKQTSEDTAQRTCVSCLDSKNASNRFSRS